MILLGLITSIDDEHLCPYYSVPTVVPAESDLIPQYRHCCSYRRTN